MGPPHKDGRLCSHTLSARPLRLDPVLPDREGGYGTVDSACRMHDCFVTGGCISWARARTRAVDRTPRLNPGIGTKKFGDRGAHPRV